MTYATFQEMLDAIGRDEMITLTDRDNVGEPQEPVAQTALDDATDTINGYLTTKYDLPLSSNPKSLRRYAIDIAVYFLAGSHNQLTDDIKDRYKAAISFLKDVAAGKAGLGTEEPKSEVTDADGSDNVLFDTPDARIMTRENLKGM